MSSKNRGGKNTFNVEAGMDGTIRTGGGGGGLRLQLPVWTGCLLAVLILLLLAATLAILVRHDKHDADAYICNDDDKARWECDSVFDVDPPECEPLPYSSIATGGESNICYFNLCIYFKEWYPMLNYPCFGGELYPEIGLEHCVDMISDVYPKKDRLKMSILCDGDIPVCVFHDICGYYEFISTFDLGPSPSHSSSSLPSSDASSAKATQLDAGTELLQTTVGELSLLQWGAKEAIKNGDAKRKK